MPKEYKILLGIALGAIVLGFVLFKFAGNPVEKQPLQARANAYTKGSAMAPISVTEFADFQCPACRVAHDIPNQLLAAYPNDVKIVFRHFPLPGHPHAMLAAQAAEAAGAQGKFWEMHDMLYERQNEWGDMTNNKGRDGVITLFMGYAQQLGLDIPTFGQALDSNSYSTDINDDMTAGSASGVYGTPTFYVNNTVVPKATLDEIKKEIERQKGN